MPDYKPNTFDRWYEFQKLDFYSYDCDYNEIDYAAVKALTVHLGNARYFESYAE